VSKLVPFTASKLRVVALSDGLEKVFWGFVSRDPLDFHFFVYDWKFKREQTKIFMVLDEADAVSGLMVIFNGCIVQVRGSREAVRLLLHQLDVEEVAVQVPLGCEDIVVERFPVFKRKAAVALLSLEKGKEAVNVSVELLRLGVGCAGEIAELMHDAYPEFWSVITAEGIAEEFGEALWFGVRCEGKLVAFGKAVPTPPVSHVAWIATREGYRNRGYATSVLSALLRELFVSSSTAFIYVLSDNPVAMRLYSKVGFKPCKRYLYVKT